MTKQTRKRKNLLGNTKNKARELCYAAVAVAMMVMCSWLSLLVGTIPFTLQTLGVCLTAGLLGAKRGAVAMFAYVLLGMFGVPVFAGFTGGAAKLLSPTGGYIIGFLEAALLGEGGIKLSHADFIWPMMSGMLLMWMTSTLHLLKLEKEQVDTKGKCILIDGAWVIFCLHVLCGLLYIKELSGL